MSKLNKRNPIALAVKHALLAAATVSAFSTPVAFSAEVEEDEATEENLVITGTRIRREGLTSKTPLLRIGSEEFKASGILNIEQKLNELPNIVPSFGPSSNNPGNGTARVDLRGLGSARTLVLVNGRRWMASDQSGVVDLNTIPAALIENVDIITGGASAVYGSDAIGGVVNFMLRDDFEGVELNSLYDLTTRGDGEKFDFSLTMGGNFADGAGNATVYAGYSRRKALFQGDRSFSNLALTEDDGALVGGGSSGIPGTRVFGGPDLPNGNTLGRFNSNGGGEIFRDPEDRFNYAPDNFLQLPQERLTINAFAHYDINSDHTIYTEVSSIRNVVPQELAPTPAFVGGLEVNPNSAFFGSDVQAAFNALVPELDSNGDPTGNLISQLNANGNFVLPFIGRRMVENGSRQSIDTRNAFRINVGMRGSISDEWTYDVYYSRHEMDQSNLLNNDVSESRFRQASLVNDAGTACQDTSGGCAPLNIFGAGNISQAAIDFVNVGATNVTNVKQEIFNASVAGELPFSFPAASTPVDVVIGVESRYDTSSFRPDEFLSSGDVLGFNAGEATAGSYSSKEVYGELNLPLVQDAGFAKDLSLWFAGRLADYSNVGNVSSFATALNWAPNDMINTRISFQRAVRAPNINELFLGASNGFPGADDPCAVEGFIAGTTDTALCVASGVPANQVGVFEQANTQVEGLFGGNSALNEEESDTFTVGIVVTPVQDLSITVDYFDIQIDNAIDVFGGGVQNILNLCFNEVKDINSNLCQAISRRPDGNVDTVIALNENIASINTSGFDINFNYKMDLGSSQLMISSISTILDTYDVTPVSGRSLSFECAGNFGPQCGRPRPDFKSFNRISWSQNDLTLSTLIRYISSVNDDSIDNNQINPSTLVVPQSKAEFYVDLSALYQVSDSLSVVGGVKNIFDNLPTRLGDAQQQANTFPEVYDVLGTRFFLSMTYNL